MKALLHLIILITLPFFLSCGLPEVKEAQFIGDSQEVIDSLKKLQNFEDVGIRWNTASTNGQSKNILIIYLVNGENLSDNDEELGELGNKAMRMLIQAIHNESDFHEFQVGFVEETQGLVKEQTVKRFVYPIENLK